MAEGVPDQAKITIDNGRVLITASVGPTGLRKLMARLIVIEKLIEEDAIPHGNGAPMTNQEERGNG